MKTNILALAIGLRAFNATSQNVSVEKSTYGIQTGFLGVWLHKESKLTNAIALRAELGLDAGVFGGYLCDRTGFILVPIARSKNVNQN